MINFKNKRFIVLAIGIIVMIAIILLAESFINKYSSNEVILQEAQEEENSNDDKSEIKQKDLKNEVGVNLGEDIVEEPIDKLDDDINNKSEMRNEKIYVYITGEVNNAGVVTLQKGSRIVDAIDAASGTTANADISKVNLVYVLEDGMKVNIPSKDELKKNPNFEYITSGSGDGANDKLNGSDVLSSSIGSSKGNSLSKIDMVNINTATQTELETLPGIGPSLALKIINYRNENGKFSSIEDIKNVNGIGESKFNDIKIYIVV